MNNTDIQTAVFTGHLLNTATKKISSSFDNFSGWLLAGFGAALTLLIANLDTVSKFVPLALIKSASFYFLASAVLAVFNKLLASFVAAGTTTALEAAEFGRDTSERGIQIDLDKLFFETEKAFFWPGSSLAHRAFEKAKAGDFLGPARLYSKVAQLQALMVLVQAILSLISSVIIVQGFGIDKVASG